MQVTLPRNQSSQVTLRPEEALLLCCARTAISQATSDRIHYLLQSDLDWSYLLQLAYCHGVLPLLYWTLKKPDFTTSVPAAYLEPLHLAFQRNAQTNLIWTQELIRLSRVLENQGISAIAFKGPLLAASVYRNLSLRRITDLDLLLNPSELDQATDVLVAQGYELRITVPWERHLIRQNGLYNIDLHPTIAPSHLSCGLTNQEIWQDLQPFKLGGTTLLNLSPEMTLLVLCLHGTKEGWWHLNRICDVAELVRNGSLDWQRVLQDSDRRGSRRLVFLGLYLAHTLLEAPLPEEIQSQLEADPVVKSLGITVQRTLFAKRTQKIDEVERSLFHMTTRERLRDRIQVFSGLMNHSGWFTPTEKDRETLSLPKSLAWLYYLLRPIRVFNKYRLDFLQLVFHQSAHTASSTSNIER